MDIRKIKKYANIGMNLSGVAFLICSLYRILIKDYISTELLFGILAVMAASTGLLNSLITAWQKTI
jgi:hypothetical protein